MRLHWANSPRGPSAYPALIVQRRQSPRLLLAIALMDDCARKPAPHVGWMRSAHLDPVVHPAIWTRMTPPGRLFCPRLDESAKLVRLFSPLEPPRNGLPWAEFRRDRLSNAAHAGNRAKQGQTGHPQSCTYYAHIQHVTMCRIRRRCISVDTNYWTPITGHQLLDTNYFSFDGIYSTCLILFYRRGRGFRGLLE